MSGKHKHTPGLSEINHNALKRRRINAQSDYEDHFAMASANALGNAQRRKRIHYIKIGVGVILAIGLIYLMF